MAVTQQGLSGVLGDILGYGPGSQSAATQLAQQGIAGPAQPNLGGFNQDAAQQQALLALLQGQAAGTGPSGAQAQLSSGIQQSIAAQNAAAAGGRYGQNAALRQQNAGNAAAGLEAGGANQAAQLRAQQMAGGAQAASGLSATMGQQQLDAAKLGQAGQQAYNNQISGLYGAEQGQQSQAGQNLQNSAIGMLTGNNASGGAGGGSGGMLGGLGSYAGIAGFARGGAPHGLSLIGEEGPEEVLGVHSGKKKLADKPQLTRLGVKEPQVVIPLKKGSAPYKGSKMPSKVTAEPSKPLPASAKAAPEKLSPEAAQAIQRLLGELKGSGPHAMADGGVARTGDVQIHSDDDQVGSSNKGIDINYPLGMPSNPGTDAPQGGRRGGQEGQPQPYSSGGQGYHRMATGGIAGMNAPVSKADILKMLLQHVTGG